MKFADAMLAAWCVAAASGAYVPAGQTWTAARATRLARSPDLAAPDGADGGGTDMIENVFRFFFGKPEEGDVSGLARTAAAPDTYPATKTEFAAPVESDGAEAAMLRPLLKNTNVRVPPRAAQICARLRGPRCAQTPIVRPKIARANATALCPDLSCAAQNCARLR